jgi:acetoin utilization protein AcuB
MAMRLRDVMTKNPITVESESLLLDARKVMKEHNFRRLPVVDKGKLVGIVTKQDLDEAMPPPTSATSAYEFRSLSRMRVKEIMKKNPLTFTPDTLFEEALKIGQKNKISSFLVVDNGKLVGITTESDIVRLLTRALGLEEEGSRITIEGLGRKLGGELQQIITIIDKNKTVLLSMLSLPRPEKSDWMIVLRVKTREPGPMVGDLKKAGFNVTYVA